MHDKVFIRKRPQGWVVRKHGAMSATAILSSKKAALEIGRYKAQMERSWLIVIEEDDSETRTDYTNTKGKPEHPWANNHLLPVWDPFEGLYDDIPERKSPEQKKAEREKREAAKAREAVRKQKRAEKKKAAADRKKAFIARKKAFAAAKKLAAAEKKKRAVERKRAAAEKNKAASAKKRAAAKKKRA